jgi:uncharacterized protein YcaQ
LKLAAFAGMLICGPPDGQSVTFVRPDRWLSSWSPPPAEDAWREIVRRFLHAYGPASRDDFARWWGMPPATAGRMLRAAADELAEVDVEGRPLWALRTDLAELAAAEALAGARLVPAFDVYVLGTRPREVLVDAEFEPRVFRQAGWISPVVLVGGRAAGVWTHSVERAGLRVAVEPFRPLTRAEQAELRREADRLGKVFDAPASVTYADVAT